MRDDVSKYPREIPRVSPTQISLFTTCQKAWEFNYITRIKRPGRKVYFDVGGYYHELSHVYYQMLREGQKAGSEFTQQYMDSRIKRAFSEVTGENVELVATVSRMIRDFVRYQSPIIDNRIQVIEVEDFLELLVDLPSGRQVVFNGYADLIYRDRSGALRVRDHKTGQSVRNYTPNSLRLNPQLLFYSALYWKLTGSMALDVEISWASSYPYKAKNLPPADQRFKLIRQIHNPASIENYWSYLVQRAESMLNASPIENYGTQCASCQYAPLCELNLRGFDIGDMIRSQYEKIDRSYTHELTEPETTSEHPETNESLAISDPELQGWRIPDFGSA